MKTKLFCLWLLLSTTISLSAYDFQSGNLYYNITSDSTVEVTYLLRYDTTHCASISSVDIPATITYNGKNYGVTGIGDWAFSGYINLTSIKISNSVTSIGNGAFEYCRSLTSITIPRSVTRIGDKAFLYCRGLTSITVESENSIFDSRDNCNAIIETATNTLIAGCKTTTIPDGVTSIGEYAFDGCSGLTSITIPNSVTSIEGSAFRGCSGLTSITIPDGVTSIGGAAFRGCSGLTSITIPNSVTSIGEYAFYGCRGLTSITIPNSVTSIGEYAFDAPHIRTIVWNAKKCVSAKNVFASDSIRSLILGDEVESIPSHFFSHQYGLDSVTIPNSVVQIGDSAFMWCGGTNFTFVSDTPPQCGTGCFRWADGNFIIPCWSEEKYRAALGNHIFVEPASDYHLFVQTNNNSGGLAQIDQKPTCRNIGEISATSNFGYHFVQWSDGNTDNPRTVTLTCDTALTAEFVLNLSGQCGNALYWQYDNHTLTISGTGRMYDYSTNSMPWLLLSDTIETIMVEQGCTHIGNNAFYGLRNVTKAELLGTTTLIGESAFANCSKLSSVYLPATLNTIGANAFAGCRKLYDIYCYAAEPPVADNSSFANYNVNLYVPCDNLRDYQMDAVFGSFKYIQCMGAENTNASDSITITPSTNDAVFIWRADETADTYTLQITKDDEVFCTLVFNANGQLCSIAFAPSRNGGPVARAAEQTATGFRFTVTGLSKQTHYAFEMKVKDKNDQLIQTYTGEFDTASDTPSSIDNASSAQDSVSKVVRNGQVLILRGGKTYTTTGVEVR